MLLATCRTEETPPGIDALHRAANVVDLEPLDADAVSDMVAGMLALTRPPAALVAHLALRTDGVPFFVAEYVRAAVALGYFERAQGRWRATAGPRWDTLPLPATGGELVACRLGRLEPGARRLASLASVLGREFEGALLEGLASDEGDLRGETAELLARSFLDEPTPGKFRFVHDRVRAVAYGELPVETRSDLHRRTARLLEEREDAWRAENGAELGMHWERAGHPDRARVHYLRAARRLEERFAHAESERLFRAYLALVSAPTSESIAARNELAGLLSHTGRFPEAGTEYEQVRSEAVSIGDAYNEANGLRGMALMRRLAGKLEEAGAIYAEALAIGERAGDVLSHAATLGAYGNLLYHLGRGLEAREAYRKVLAAAEGELPRAGGDRYRLRDVKNLREAAMMNIAVVSMDVGDYEAAESGYRATLAERQARNDTRSAAIVMGDLANLYHATGRTAEALHWAEEALRHHRNTGDRRSEAIVLTNLANVQVTVGRRDLARANYEQALVLAHEIGDVREEAATLRHVAELHEEEGALDEALAAAESSLARFTKLGDRRYIAELQGVVASILVGKGDLSRARGLLDDAIEGSRAAHDRRAEAYHRTTIAGLERRRGDLVAARAALDAAEPTFRELHDLYGIAVVLVERARLRGGGDGDAAALLSQAEEAADALGVGPAGALRSLFTAARRDLGLTGTSV
ncbi:MAG: tetratricopeptide repeat protein [Acidobacteriota bacterium]